MLDFPLVHFRVERDSLLRIRNGDSLGYCWREAATSLLPVVDELILCDSDSNDGTREAMDWEDNLQHESRWMGR